MAWFRTAVWTTFGGLTAGALFWTLGSRGVTGASTGAVAPAADDAPPVAGAHPPSDGHRPPGLERLAGFHYLAAVSGGAAPDAPLPMVIALHGVANRARVPQLPYFGVEAPLRLIRPQAPEPYEDGFTWFPVRFFQDSPATLARHVRQRADELAVLIRRLRERHPTRGKPIVLGFSQGGTLAFGIAVRHPDQVAAAFPLAPSIPDPLLEHVRAPSEAGPRIRVLHSEDDPIAAIGPTRRAVAQLRERGFDVALEEVRGHEHRLSPEMGRIVRRWLETAVREQAP